MRSLQTACALLTFQPPVSNAGSRKLENLTRPSRVRMFRKHRNVNSGRMKHHVKCSHRWVPNTHAPRKQSASLKCGAAPGGAVETRPVTIKSPTEAPIIGLVNPPKLDDGGTGLPPRDDGGGGGGGGGGGSSSGGFLLFGFLLILSYLKDLEAEKES